MTTRARRLPAKGKGKGAAVSRPLRQRRSGEAPLRGVDRGEGSSGGPFSPRIIIPGAVPAPTSGSGSAGLEGRVAKLEGELRAEKERVRELNRQLGDRERDIVQARAAVGDGEQRLHALQGQLAAAAAAAPALPQRVRELEAQVTGRDEAIRALRETNRRLEAEKEEAEGSLAGERAFLFFVIFCLTALL